MDRSIFVRASQAFAAQVEIGVGSLERATRGGLSRQSVRDIEAAADEARSQRFAAEQRRDDAVREQTRRSAEAADWGEKAVYAVSKQRADLAERAIWRQLDCEQRMAAAASDEQAAAVDIVRLGELVEELTAERRRMLDDLATLDRETRADMAGNGRRIGPTLEQRAEQARVRLERLVEDERASRPTAAAASVEAELDEMRRADLVAERLAALLPTAGKARTARRSPVRG